MLPGSRLMYWLGVEGIKSLRRRWKGETRAFHDTLLSFGHMPRLGVDRRGNGPRRPARPMTDPAATEPLLEIKGLVTEFRTETGIVRAVKGVDLSVRASETVALVGESGSGKTVTACRSCGFDSGRIGRIVAGEIRFKRPRRRLCRPGQPARAACAAFAATRSR